MGVHNLSDTGTQQSLSGEGFDVKTWLEVVDPASNWDVTEPPGPRSSLMKMF